MAAEHAAARSADVFIVGAALTDGVLSEGGNQPHIRHSLPPESPQRGLPRHKHFQFDRHPGPGPWTP